MNAGPGRPRALLLGTLVCCLLAAAASGRALQLQKPAGEAPAAPKPKAKTLRVVIDYGDGVEKHFTRLAWSDGLTVLDAMQAASESPHGIAFKYTGRGETAFATQIDDLKNQGAGKKNWMYSVNGKRADRSFGVYKPAAADVVRWEFVEYNDRQ
ncbi:MAG: DUF4430 domain-containing protein [Pirellulales bacterium]